MSIENDLARIATALEALVILKAPGTTEDDAPEVAVEESKSTQKRKDVQQREPIVRLPTTKPKAQPKKRKRRTKAEIEADKAREEEEEDTLPAPAADDDDLLAQDEEVVTTGDLHEELKKLVKNKGRDRGLAVLTEFGADCLSAVAESDYSDLLVVLKAVNNE